PVWTVAVALGGAVGLVVLSIAHNVPVMVVGWSLVQAGLNGMLATLISAIPDRVPVEQRAQTGGFIGISQMFGTVLGTLLVTVLVTSLSGGYLASAVVVVVGAALFVLFTPDAVLPKELRPRTRLDLWVSPKEHPDFAWMWCCHFLIQLGNAFGTFYLLFFLKDAVHLADPDTALLILMAFYGLALILGAVLAGIYSDRSGRRKPYVLLSVALMAGPCDATSECLAYDPCRPRMSSQHRCSGCSWPWPSWARSPRPARTTPTRAWPDQLTERPRA
ncbi:MFS transporter, partial [Kibdelosporangium lantanae]